MPNPSGKMNQHEREICARFKLTRERLNQSERNLAMLLGVSRDQLAGVEYARTPLNSGIAFSLAKYTGCNLNWLAEGTGPERGPLPSPDLIGQISPRSIFSTAWKAHLKKALTPGTKHFGQNWEGSQDSLEIGGLSALDYSKEEIEGYFNKLPPELHWNFFADITKACRDFEQMNRTKIVELNAHGGKTQNKNLTHAETPAKLPGIVKPQLPSLLERLKQATKETGKMSALADYLKVPLASVSRWLSGKREPGGEITLQMLKWVEAQERQK
jgi:transcriptional regulator with XRE-family HTH domain